MSQYRTEEDVRNYDIFKGIVTALLLVTLFIVAALGYGGPAEEAAPVAESDAAAEVAGQEESMEGDIAVAPPESVVSAPDLLSPAPGSALETGPATFSGMGTPGSQVALVAGGSELGRTLVDENGTWELAVQIPTGIEGIQLQALDSSGTVVATSDPIPMTTAGPAAEEETGAEAPSETAVPVIPPAVNFPDEDLRAGQPIPFTGTGQPGASLQLLANGADLGQVEVAEDGTWALETTLPEGDYEIDIAVLDEDGNVLETVPAISIPVLAPAAPRFVVPELAIPEFNPLTGSLAWNGESAPGSRVAAIVDDEIVDEATADSDGRWNLNLGLDPGSYSLAFGQLDQDGNITSSSEPVAIEVPGQLPQLVLPDFSLPDALPEEEAAGLDKIALPEIKLPAGPLELVGSAEPGDEVALLVDGQVAGTAVADDEGNFTLPADLAAGARSLQLGIVGADGTLAARSKEIAMAVTSMALPTIALPELSGEETEITVSGTAEPGSTVEIKVDGQVVGQTTAADDGTWTFAVAPPAETASLRAQALGEDGLPALFSSPVALPGTGEAVAEAPAEGQEPTAEETEEPAEGEAEQPAEEEQVPGVSGTVTYEEQIAIPGDSVITVEIINISQADATAEVIGEQVIEAEDRPVPIPYRVPYDPAEIDDTLLYGVTARIAAGDGTLLFISETTIPVITGDNPTEEVEIVTTRVRSAAADAELGGVDTELEETADTVLEAMQNSGQFTTLLEGIDAAGLTDQLAQAEGSYTVFAPTDTAFASLPPELLAGWNFNPEEYARILRNMVVEGKYGPDDLTDGLVLRTISGSNIGVIHDGERITINSVPVIDAAGAGESYVYALPQVIMPPLPAGVTAPTIDESGVPIFIGEILTVVGVAEPGQRIVVTVDGERFGDIATVDGNSFWLVTDEISPGIHNIIAYMIDNNGLLQAISQEVTLAVPEP